MRLLAYFVSTAGPLAALAPVFFSSFTPVSASIVAPRNLNTSLIPPECNSTCQPALSAQSTCGTDFKCLCTNTNGKNFEQCIDCVVGSASGSLVQSVMQGVLNEYVDKCAKDNFPISSLSLSAPVASSTSTSTTPNGATNAVQASFPVIAALQFLLLFLGMLASRAVRYS
ncbi:hypothetical protein C8R43DRAFT_306598 [Mycena crocata]|nr:hypothetical protein C8R43DRAFT_306598 [Mycena crocata]